MIAASDYLTVKCKLRSRVIADSAKGLGHAELEKLIAEKVDPIWDQVCRDALIGTYGDYSPALFTSGSGAFGRLQSSTAEAAKIVNDIEGAHLTTGELPFTLQLQAKWFQQPRIGLQQLVHVLCGDIFNRATSELMGNVEVESVEFGELRTHFESEFRGRSHSIKQIRSAFQLNGAPLLYAKNREANLPLLAFSLKPRNGLDPADFKRIAMGVLRAGFNIVEADVRNVDFVDPAWRKLFGEVAQEALTIESHVARFSLNVSGPSDLALLYAKEFRDLHKGKHPWVVKVDGGVDGLSTIQAIRKEFVKNDQPVITCYPILGAPLASRLGGDTFRELLVMSGADVIYPGNAPRIGEGNFIDNARAQVGIARYREILARGWPMPSIAGGVHAGQLPVYLRIFGPDAAYFLGGGVALHRNGAFFDTNPLTNPGGEKAVRPQLGKPVKLDQAVGGAELCRFAVETAATTKDDETLLKILVDTRNEYVPPDPDAKPGTKYQFEQPGLFLKRTKTEPFKEDP